MLLLNFIWDLLSGVHIPTWASFWNDLAQHTHEEWSVRVRPGICEMDIERLYNIPVYGSLHCCSFRLFSHKWLWKVRLTCYLGADNVPLRIKLYLFVLWAKTPLLGFLYNIYAPPLLRNHSRAERIKSQRGGISNILSPTSLAIAAADG